ncbi:phosphohexomutase (phosphoglucomutase / phosphomannomutase) [Natronomonas pharaonis DSM 2160]|uniref:Phosphohexomutase (Phosphoglucomutase / phosphomannomutase) n=1 Tax=Natronomonas pharaonis (strain ATCC 35678 / DSM 2160 / CIP 103997 / JCM 8858 / NBRC 14720 / NCIMB 2260 / Gabara) TaxID=348780 RepID=A0A1U7EXE5_NATPD|nr:phosphomannomutase [Natronomonas pharaonis]CAI49848.1 phosphohexomutase (phosphoglucomutase / phosphomannomutase) [Natronomonas pharaonis DSM 2160]
MDLFGTAGIRGAAQTDVTPSLALAAGRAAAEDGATFVVGRDGRETGPALAAAVEAGLESGGADVYRLGAVPTPTLAYASRGRRGIMVTASHNPPADNGLKFFVDGTEYDRDAERRVESRVLSDPSPVEWDEWGDSYRMDVLEAYRTAVVEYVKTSFGDCEGLRVAVDCGNGMASHATPQVLRELGAEIVALNANVDGHFPGRESKPTAESLEALRTFVADGEFDLGIGHDGDADRIVVIDSSGDVVHEDTVLAILAKRYTAQASEPSPVVVTTPNASGRIDEAVEAAGGSVERVRLGALHEGIADASAGEGTVVFAAEPWKHTHTRFGPWIDGVASAAVLGALVADRGIEPLREPITERPYRKHNVDCPDEDKSGAMSLLESRLPEQFPEATATTDHGVRLAFDDGSWVLVRPSGTEPYLRLYAESESVDALVDDVAAVVRSAVAEAD